MKKLIVFLLILTTLVFICFLSIDRQLIVIPGFHIPKLLEKKSDSLVPVVGWNLGNNVYRCSTDDDCILVSVGTCCDFVAINKNFKDEIQSTPMICTQVCYTEALCNKSVCQITKSK
ncbi:MAG: hypothetical protein WCV93_03865 [Candidatus Shapirobacteria bacterium]|jgi:hypothetical protein